MEEVAVEGGALDVAHHHIEEIFQPPPRRTEQSGAGRAK